MTHSIKIREDVKLINEKLGVEIPDSYVEFLLAFSGGQPLNNVFRKFEGGKLIFDFDIDLLFGMDEGRAADLYSNKIVYADRIPADLLPIGNDGVGNIICLGIAKENYDQVYIWYDKERELNEPPSYIDIKKLTNSFSEFVDCLQPQE